MSKIPLDVLKSGLVKLKNLTKTKKDDLLACLHRKKISTKEEEWLDNATNPVDDDDVVNKKKPTCLLLAFTLGSYVADINDPFARRLESILASFGRQTWLEEARALEPTYITDFFTCK